MSFFKSIQKFVKQNIGIVSVVSIIILGVIIALIFLVLGNKETKEPVSRFSNTEELIENVDEVTAKVISENKIEFSSNISINTGERVAVWIYSEPKFLGYFIVQEVNGVKFIEGLKEALENIEVSIGIHHLALSEDSGIYIGYIEVSISENGYLQDVEEKQPQLEEDDSEQLEDDEQLDEEIVNDDPVEEEQEETPNTDVDKTTVKREVVEEAITYSTREINEVNMLRGTKEVTQTGKNGIKEVTYSITIDSNGKEISRQKTGEQVISEPVDEIIKVGISDYNLNTDKFGIENGYTCVENQLTSSGSGDEFCDAINYNLGSYFSININGRYYATCIDNSGTSCWTDLAVNLSSPLLLSDYKGYLKFINYNGQKLILSPGAGDELAPLTQEICDRFHLSCGRW